MGIKEKELVPVSQLNIIECCSTCRNVKQVFQYTIENGINTDTEYPPYPNDGTCNFDETKKVITIDDYKEVQKGDEQDLSEKIATHGPVSVLIDAGQMSFQLYNSGVYYDPNCHYQSSQLNHAVLAVGYGSTTDAEYYIVKNSWGTSWGESGYIRMSRNRDNNCGIATDASFPIA